MKYPDSELALPNWWAEHRSELLASYASGQTSFLPFALPEQVLRMPMAEVLDLLKRRLGSANLEEALNTSEVIPGPHAQENDSTWIKSTNMVGINIRTVGDFAGVLKYALTLPASQNSIHLLPFWEPGVLSSLYAMSSWNINPEFYSGEWAASCPNLNTPERQLKALVNLLHLLGKSVGLDVIPHVDRYAEIVLAQPAHFEWLQRKDAQIVSHRANLHEEVEDLVWNWLQQEKPAGWVEVQPESRAAFFQLPEPTRLHLLFGPASERVLRSSRRAQLIDVLVAQGFEPVPATMSPPYRGLEVDPESRSVDAQGRVWCEYRMKHPTPMSRVFGPLTRYKLYGRLDDNRDWAIDFSCPRKQVWDYVCEHFASLQAAYGFDFMRGDMSHVQMRPEGVPAEGDDYYDIHRAIKHRVIQQAPHFAYFAESFLAPPNSMAFGVEEDHLEMSCADTTLGDLQSMVPGSPEFLQQLRRYMDLSQTRTFSPSVTVMTGDKDDPRFDHFYRHGNEARLFLSLFLSDMPGYMALGFECRNRHDAPADNEYYSKLYVFRNTEGPQAVRSAYRWGQNHGLFFRLSRIRLLAEQLLPKLRGLSTQWLLPPDTTGGRKVLVWTQVNAPRCVFAVSLEANLFIEEVQVPWPFSQPLRLRGLFSSDRIEPPADVLPSSSGRYTLLNLQPGECVVFETDEL